MAIKVLLDMAPVKNETHNCEQEEECRRERSFGSSNFMKVSLLYDSHIPINNYLFIPIFFPLTACMLVFDSFSGSLI